MLTKTDMARVIFQALENLPTLPAADHFKVKKIARRKREIIVDHYKLAYKIITGHEVMGVK